MAKWIPIYIDNYETSYEITKSGKIRNAITKEIKKTHINMSGYEMVNIYYNHKWRLMSVHRLVAITFIPNPDNKPEINHIDGIKTNNHVNNLEWVSREENIRHAYKTGLNKNLYGFDARHNKYPINMISNVINHLKKDPSNMSKIARETGIPIDTVFLIKTGRRYKDLSISLGFTPIPSAKRFDFSNYHDKILDLVSKGYASCDIRRMVPLDVDIMVYNYYIRKLRRELKNKLIV